MAIELKDAFEYLGLDAEKVQSLDDFKKGIEESFIHRNMVTKDEKVINDITGKYFGSIVTDLKSSAKEFGIEFSGAELQNKKVKDIFADALTRQKDAYGKTIDEIKAKGGAPAEEVKKWEDKYNKLHTQFSDLKSLNENLVKEYDGYKSQTASEKKGIELKYAWNQELGKIQYKPGIKETEKLGFEALLSKSVKPDFDESGKLIITDTEGKQIPNPKKAGTFYSAEEMLKEMAVKAEVVALNPHAGKPAPKPATPFVFQTSNGNGNGAEKKILAPINTRASR